MSSYTKYNPVPTDEPKDKVETRNSVFDYSSAFNYKSAFSYNTGNTSQYRSAFDYGYGPKRSNSLVIEKDPRTKRQTWSFLGIITAFVTLFSYLIILVTFPVTLWFCIKRLQQWERLILFRIGRLHGVKGPGMVFIIPWIDRYTRIDMRTKAFSVPPQQLITIDNGIIEMGCEIKYRISDVQQLTTSVITPQHGLRSFGKTVMLNVLTKHTVREMERDRLLIASEILKEINARVANWGIEIGQVDLSTVNVLKEAEPDNPLKPLLNALNGGSSGTEAPSVSFAPPPMASATTTKNASSLLDFGSLAKAGLSNFQGFMGSDKKKPKHEAPTGHAKMGTDLIHLLDDRKESPDNKPSFSHFISSQLSSKEAAKNTRGGPPAKTKVGKLLQSLVEGPGGADLTNAIYRLQIDGKEAEVYVIFVANGMRQVLEGDVPGLTPDVSVTLSATDLMAVLEGSLPPLQAYLSGRLSVTGDAHLLMGLETLRQAAPQASDDASFIV